MMWEFSMYNENGSIQEGKLEGKFVIGRFWEAIKEMVGTDGSKIELQLLMWSTFARLFKEGCLVSTGGNPRAGTLGETRSR